MKENYAIQILNLKIPNKNQKIISQFTTELNTYSEFKKPVFISETKIAFIGANDARADIFIYNLKYNRFLNLTESENLQKIDDLSIRPQNDKIYFSGKQNGSYVLGALDLNNGLESYLIKSKNVISHVRPAKNGVYFIGNENKGNVDAPGLYFIDFITKEVTNIVMIAEPAELISFDLSNYGDKITFETYNNETEKSNISVCDMSGENLIQLTNDGISINPIFSPDGTRIAFIKKNDGLFTIALKKTDIIKVLNQNNINFIYFWR